MGCISSKPSQRTEDLNASKEQPKTYSWSNREKLNPKDYMADQLTDQVVVKGPGTINGQQYIIQNCNKCTVALLDHCNTVTIDECNDCTIFVGPTKGSVVVRNTIDCRLMIACQQFRTRDCKFLTCYLLCATQPAIEASIDIKFGPFSCNYPQLLGQLKEAGLSPFNNKWNQIYDFTAIEGEQHWSLILSHGSAESRPEMMFNSIKNAASRQEPQIDVDFDRMTSIVPLIHYYDRKSAHRGSIDSNNPDAIQTAVVIFFNDGQQDKRALNFIKEIQATKSCHLVHAKELLLSEHDALQVFSNDHHQIAVIKRGPIIVLEFSGSANTIAHCQTLAKSCLPPLSDTYSIAPIYVSSSNAVAQRLAAYLFSKE